MGAAPSQTHRVASIACFTSGSDNARKRVRGQVLDADMRNSACATPGLIFEIPVTLLGAIVFGGLGGYFLGPWSGAIGATIGLASGFRMGTSPRG